MKNSKKWADQPDGIRLELLAENCHHKENMTIYHHFSDEELEEMRKQNSDLTIQLDDVEDEKKELMSEINARIKKIKSESKSIRKEIKAGKVEIQIQAFAFDNQETGMMEYYNGAGELVSQRPLHPSERQLRITKTGTNN